MPLHTTFRQHDDHRAYEITGFGNSLDVTVTNNADVADEWLHVMIKWNRIYFRHSRLVIGLSVFWSPHIAGPDGPAETVQVCVGHQCLIYQLYCSDEAPEILRSILKSNKCTFVGFWNSFDRHKLRISHHELEMRRDPLELRNFTNERNSVMSPDVNLRWDMAMGDWGMEVLSDEQVQLASLDAYNAFLFGSEIEAWQF